MDFFSLISGKIIETYEKTILMFNQFPGRQKNNDVQMNAMNNISSDEVDEGDNSDNEGSIEQEIRLSVSAVHQHNSVQYNF